MIQNPDKFKHYVESFNNNDIEYVSKSISNDQCWEWMCENIPWFECPDKDIEQMYYFRWWVFRKHLKETPAGFVVTEFLPEVKHARKYNTISCALGHHIEEGRWLHNRDYMRDYIRFWFSADGDPLTYSNWLASAVLDYCLATADFEMGDSLLDELVNIHRKWEDKQQHACGLFWSNDGRDGGENSISGNGIRPTLNSYMFGSARAISILADHCGKEKLKAEFDEKAHTLKRLVQTKLWDENATFFKTYPLDSVNEPEPDWAFSKIDPNRNVREIYGFLPWKFSMPDRGTEDAWAQIKDAGGFFAPFGLTTAEQRHPQFMKNRIKRCQWDGSSWPFTTSLALDAMSKLLHEYKQSEVTKHDYFEILKNYTRSQRRVLPYGEEIPWIGESLHPTRGIWLSRAIAFEVMYPGIQNRDLQHFQIRGKDYNHSKYCDLVISQLIGLNYTLDGTVAVAPLIPEGVWEWFCLDNVKYGNNNLTILYDKNGTKYGRGKGLRIFLNNREIAHNPHLSYLQAKI